MPDEIKGEQCQRCNEVDLDRRTLWMACFYEMSELGIPFNVREISVHPDPLDKRRIYTLRVCKRCRAEWMGAIKAWFETKPPADAEVPADGAIYIRRFGHAVPVSREEYEKLRQENE